MRRNDLIMRVRSVTRDFSNSIFREKDIIDFINEGIDRFRQFIPELSKMNYLLEHDAMPNLLPEQYHHLLSVYASSRCFSQDERHYQATTLMNEFETKLEELKSNIEDGSVTIIDSETGKPVSTEIDPDYVNLEPYWGRSNNISFDEDEGVEGVG